jgi:formyl-CoA transferase
MFDATLAMADMVPQLWSMGAPKEWAAAGATAIVAAFRARDGWFVVSVFREHHFERLARLVGHPEWPADPRFATREGWAAQVEPTIRPAVEAWAARKSRIEACRALCEVGVAAGPSNGAEDIAADPHVAARDMLVEVPRGDAERSMLVVGNPVKMSRLSEGPVSPFPGLGEHGDALLAGELGLDAAALADLRARGVI